MKAEPNTADYHLLQTLVADRTFLCTDASDNVVVLKKLDDDCLHYNQLHPNIRDRLAKVRELAHPRIAALRTVERWNGNVCLVWVYLDGETWDESIAQSPQNFYTLASTLVSSVAALHELGIVHGNLHSKNIIVRPDRQVWLTDVSPYLYSDPAADAGAIVDLLKSSPLCSRRILKLLEDVDSNPMKLKQLSHALLITEEPQKAISEISKSSTEQGYRFTSLLWATACIAAAVCIWFGVHLAVPKSAATSVVSFPSLRHP